MASLLTAPFIVQISCVIIAFVYTSFGNYLYRRTVAYLINSGEMNPHNDILFFWFLFIIFWPFVMVLGFIVKAKEKK
jgi:hypothetical protein